MCVSAYHSLSLSLSFSSPHNGKCERSMIVEDGIFAFLHHLKIDNVNESSSSNNSRKKIILHMLTTMFQSLSLENFGSDISQHTHTHTKLAISLTESKPSSSSSFDIVIVVVVVVVVVAVETAVCERQINVFNIIWKRLFFLAHAENFGTY